MSTIMEPEDEIYREIIVRSLGQGAMINRTDRSWRRCPASATTKSAF